MKINSRYNGNDEFDQTVVTIPNQAFTPRQILEQFARNEVVPTFRQATDTLDDSNFKDDDLLDSDVMEFDDDMEAQTYLEENQFRPYEENQSGSAADQGNPPASNQADVDTGQGSDSTN